MSNSDDDHSSSDGSPTKDDTPVAPVEFEEPDEDTLRVLISTDNHLGYLESDPVRGLDSFAAFEEVLYLAKLQKVDMVLLGGDLFHHNKPSRRTLHKTMGILRRYAMGPDPVKIQVLSDQEKDFRNISKCVNYEDPNYSIDLPIFSIHGNHDDPSREGGAMLAALDLLSVNNLVNYFGRQDDVKKIEISPVLIQKGTTKVALYGLGNLRDERLNRMWQTKQVRFLRPENGDDDKDKDDDDDNDEENNNDFFNILTLHQNRDNMGRGAKNCVHESMIPAFMDLVVWGHEHASEPQPQESVVGTFRISQPGSSVATSLTTGEAQRKHAIVLNVRGNQFRMEPIPLTMVRSFVMHDVSLAEHDTLDPEDPKVDDEMTRILVEELKIHIYNAREKQTELLDAAKKAGNHASTKESSLEYKMEKRDEVLVRLRVEHTGFTTLNNQRFGAQFVGEVANPTDILLFQRAKKKTTASSGGGAKGKTKKARGAADGALDDPVEPEELHQVSVEDLVKENLETADQRLHILSEKALSLALEEFVDKTEANAIFETAEKALKKRQNFLFKSGGKGGDDDDTETVSTAKDVRRHIEKQTQDEEERSQAAKRKRGYSSGEDSLDKENQAASNSGRAKAAGGPKKKPSKTNDSISIDVADSSEDEDMAAKKKTSKGKAGARKNSGDIRSFTVAKSSLPKSQSQSSQRRKKVEDDFDDDDDDDVEIVSVKKRAAPPRRRTTKSQVNYSVDLSDEDNDDDDFGDEEPPKKKPARKAQASSARGKTSRGRKGQSQDSSMGDLDSNWGSASTRK